MEKSVDSHDMPTLLVVDDNEDMLEALTHFLVDYDYNVLAANTGKEAVSIFEANKGRVDLTLLDVGMPDMEDFEVLLTIKQINQDAKILYMSGITSETTVERQIVASGIYYIQKPFESDILYNQIRNILSDKKSA